MRFHLLLFSLAFSAIVSKARAQDEHTLHSVTVTAQRQLRQTGIERTVLDTTLLHENISLSMADILTQHSTLYIKSYGRATESTAEFRGTSPAHTQVLWNGIRINSPMLGTMDFSTIPAYFIDNATLLHGSSSLTETSGGLGGAVSLSTLPPASKGHSIQYIQGIGSFSTYDQFVRYSYAGNRWKNSTRMVYSTSKNDFKYTNYDKKVDVRDEQGHIVNSYHPTEHNQSGYFHDLHLMDDAYCQLPSGDQLSLSTWYSRSLRGLPFLSVDYKDNTEFTNEQMQHAQRTSVAWKRSRHRWNYKVNGGHTYNNVAYDYTTNRPGLNMDITHSHSYTHTAMAQGLVEWYPMDNLMLSSKGGVGYTHVRSEDKSPFHIGDNYNRGRMDYNLNVTAQWRAMERLSFSGILRGEGYGSDQVPMIPAFFAEVGLYRPWQLVAKASVARNYRYPSMDDLYFQPGGNPMLKPEKGFTYDAGIEFQSPKRWYQLSGNITAFDSHITDWILWTPNAKGYWQPSNVKRVHNYGVEMMMNADFKWREWSFVVNTNYAYTPSINRGERVNANDASYGKQLCYIPLHSANASARLGWKTWMLNIKWNSYSERFTSTSNEVNYITGRLKPYYMTDVSIEKKFDFRPLFASLRLSVNNLLDSDYITVLSRPMAPRNFELFIELRPKILKRKRD